MRKIAGGGGSTKKRKPKPPSTRSRREHQGKVPGAGGINEVPKVEARQRRKKARRKSAKSRAEAKARRKIRGTIIRAGTKTTGPDLTPDLGEAARDVADYIKEWPERVKEHADEPLPGIKPDTPAGSALATLQLATGGGAATKTVKALSAGSTAKSGKELLKDAAKGLKKAPAKKVQKVKTAPKRAVKRVRETPKRVRTAPRRARKAVRTKEGRRAVAKGAGKKAARHPIRTGIPAAAVSPVPLPGDADERAQAFLKGTAAALTHPGKVAETTGHAALGFLTAPLAVGAAGVESVKQGSTKPLRHEIRDLVYVPEDKTGTGREGGIVGMTKSLASGDPKKVEETTLQESGLVPFIPVPAIARRIKRTEAYKGARGRVRGKVESKRAKTRDKRIAAEKAAQEAGEFIPRKKARKVRHAVEDRGRPGEQYVMRRVGKFKEKQRSRHRTAREVARMEEEGMLAGGIAGAKVTKKIKSKGTKNRAQNDADALRPFVKLGLPTDKRALAIAQMLDENWPKAEHGEAIPGLHLDRHSTKYILEQGEAMFEGKRGKALAGAVKEFDTQSKPLGTSPRNQFLAQVNNVINPLLRREGRTPILTPEEMVTKGTLKYLPGREKQVNQGLPPTASQLRELKASRAMERRGLTSPVPPPLKLAQRPKLWTRTDAFKFLDDLKNLKRKHERGEAKLTPKELKELNTKIAGLAWELEGRKRGKVVGDGLMKPPELGGPVHGVSTTRAVAWTPEMESAFVNAARREVGHFGLREPAAYVADVVPSSLKGGGESLPAYGGLHPVNKVWPSQGKAARSGVAESSYESLIYNSLEAPHSRAASVRGLQRIFDFASRKVAGKRYVTRKEYDRLAATRQIPDGVIPVRTQMLRALIEGDRPVDPVAFREAMFKEIEHAQKLIAGEELAGEVVAAAELGVKGEKFALMDAVTMHELAGHMKGPSGVSVGMGHATNFATRTILNSPAFEAAQFAQEGIPMAMALGRDVANVPKAIAALAEVSKLPAEAQAQIRAVVGSSVGVLGAPKIKPWRSQGFMDPVRAAGRKQVWRHAWEVVNGSKLSRFDRARAGRFREVGAISKIEGDLRRAEKGFQLWRSGANNLFKDMEKAVEAMKGMNRAERLAYVAEHPALGDRLMRSMSKMAGNWNAFTVFEKNISPFTVFYPFQRYSVLWVLYHFPLDHPVVATSLTALGAVNAQELQKIAAEEGATPGVLDYAKPVVGGDVLPAGQRFSAVLGSVQQAVLGGKPEAVLSGLSPLLGISIEAITGKNSFTGEGLGMTGWEYLLRQGANLSPLLRFVGLPEVGEEESVASKAFAQYDKDRAERSFFNPYIGQSGKDYAKEKKLEKGFEDKYSKGRQYKSNLPPEVWAAAYNGDWEAAKRLRRERIKAERGSDRVRQAEKPFFDEDGGKLSDEGSKILRYITGQIVLPAPKKKPNPFGIPDTDSDALREQFGIPSTSPSELRKMFGIE